MTSLLLCVMTLGLVACGKDKTSDTDTEVTESVEESSEDASEEIEDLDDSLKINSLTDSEGNEIEDYEVVCSMSDEEIESNITGVYKVLKTADNKYLFAVYADTYEDFIVVDIGTYCDALGVSKELVENTLGDGTFYDVFGYAYPDSYNNGHDEHDHEHDDILMTPEEFQIDSIVNKAE